MRRPMFTRLGLSMILVPSLEPFGVSLLVIIFVYRHIGANLAWANWSTTELSGEWREL